MQVGFPEVRCGEGHQPLNLQVTAPKDRRRVTAQRPLARHGDQGEGGFLQGRTDPAKVGGHPGRMLQDPQGVDQLLHTQPVVVGDADGQAG